MNWRLRALLLRAMARAPFGYEFYQFLQRRMGLHCRPRYILKKLETQAALARMAVSRGVELSGAHVVELGTGWVPIVPLGFWICGARVVDTYDLNRHMLPSVLRSALQAMVDGEQHLTETWDGLVDAGEVREKLEFARRGLDDPLRLLSEVGVRYHAPADAAATDLPSDSVDLHYSTSVLEHVGRDDLVRCLREAGRLLRPGGVSVHRVDPADHFARTDSRITEINFLQFEEAAWDHLSGHRLAYHNRLRDEDFRRIFAEAGLEIVSANGRLDERSLSSLENGFPLASPFAGREWDELCRHDLDYVAQAADGLREATEE